MSQNHIGKGREPTLKELAERLDVDVETLTIFWKRTFPESIYAVTNDNDSSPLYLIDKLADENTQGQDNDMNESSKEWHWLTPSKT